MESLKLRIEKLDIIEIEQEHIDKINFKFPPAPHSGKVTLLLKNISKNYDELSVLENINLEISKSDKIAFVGKNESIKDFFKINDKN